MHIFIGPELIDVRPLEITLPPTRLMQQIPYGQTVYRDANGTWFSVYAPGIEQLNDASPIFQGGRIYVLDDAEQTALIAAGYGDYITEVDETQAPWCNPPFTTTKPVDLAAVVGSAVVGFSVLAA